MQSYRTLNHTTAQRFCGYLRNWCAEDEKVALDLLVKYFTLSGFTVYTAETCKAAIQLACRNTLDCFLFDYHLADGPVTPACLFIRSHGRLKDAPIVMLSGDPNQAIHSYNICQADLFLDKGRSYPEILAAVKRQLRRTVQPKEPPKRSDLTLDAKGMWILKNGQPLVCLSPEQFRFFAVLFERKPDFVPEDVISAYVFKDLPGEKREAIASLVYRLRRNLGPRHARRIKNRKGLGWVYVQPRLREKTLLS
jgi:DNA-binding response OmpR family regulator